MLQASALASASSRDVARATTDGVSAAIDGRGRIVARAPLYTACFLVQQLHLRSLLTVYTRFGDWFVGLCVLLIVAALDDSQLASLHGRARELGMATLVEVHDAAELERALSLEGALVGINNRNLRTLEVDVKASETLIAKMPKGVIAVSESGLRSADDLIRLRALGYQAFLVGERFMTTPDPGAALKDLLTGAPCL